MVDNSLQKEIKKIWNKIGNKEFVQYVFWGIMTTVLNVVAYNLLCYVMKYWIANLIAMIICKVFAYMTNKFFVFKSRCSTWKELMEEFVRYILLRSISGIIDLLGLVMLVEILWINQRISKYIVTMIVVLVNYIFGKKYVFTKRDADIFNSKKEAE